MPEFFRGWRRKVGVVTLLVACQCACFWILRLCNQNHNGRAVIRFGWHDGSCKTQAGLFVSGAEYWPFWMATNRVFHEVIFDDRITWRKISGRTSDVSMRLPIGFVSHDPFNRQWFNGLCDRSEVPMWPFQVDWEWKFSGIHFGQMHDLDRHCDEGKFVFRFWTFPYWSVVVPLTLISGCLLVSKHRRADQKGRTSLHVHSRVVPPC